MTLGTDTTLPGNDAAMSGAASNYARTSFATVTAMATRLSMTTFPAAASVDIRGRYRIFARVRKTVALDVINVRVQCDAIITDPVRLPSTTDNWIHWVDLGLITIPNGFADPITEGFSNTVQSIEPVNFNLQAERVSGTGNLDWDVVMALPADEELCIASFNITAAGTGRLILDGPNEMIYERNASDRLDTKSDVMKTEGLFLHLTPNQTNRIALLGRVDTVNNDAKADSWLVTVSFWPGYLYCRPAST